MSESERVVADEKHPDRCSGKRRGEVMRGGEGERENEKNSGPER